MSTPTIRRFRDEDRPHVIELWRSSGLLRSWNDPDLDIDRKLAVRDSLFLVAVSEDRPVGTVMAGYDGHRGWINYLAVDPMLRGRGVGWLLMDHAERRLRDLGCPKVNLQIRADNRSVAEFYERLGYSVDDVLSMGKRLVVDADASVPTTTERQPATSASTAEGSVVDAVDHPTTRTDIESALRAVGVADGSVVIVHSSLSSMGWVVGGPVSVVEALRSVVGPDGTIVMPAQTGMSDPSHWQFPPVPTSWWSTIRSTWPSFDPLTTPLRGMGAVVECFARLPGAVHSGHPSCGFVAHGPAARQLMHPHPLDDAFGDGSPLARLYEHGADIVLLGVGHGNNTSLHLAEARGLGERAPTMLDGAALDVDGERAWVEYSHVAYDEGDFEELGDAYAAQGGTEQRVTVGTGEFRRLPMRELVDFGTDWIATHRTGTTPPGDVSSRSVPGSGHDGEETS